MKTITDDSIMPFGKYKGMKMIDIPASFFKWYAHNGPPGNIKEYAIANLDNFETELGEKPTKLEISIDNANPDIVRASTDSGLQYYAQQYIRIRTGDNTIRSLNEVEIELLKLIDKANREGATIRTVWCRGGYKHVLITE